eukprot:jgi/Pico_ML_1/54479/g4818.t2
MPYLSYGWPKRFAAGGGRSASTVHEAHVLHLGFHEGLLLRVSTDDIEAWKEQETLDKVFAEEATNILRGQGNQPEGDLEVESNSYAITQIDYCEGKNCMIVVLADGTFEP